MDLLKEITPWLLAVAGIIWLTGWLTNKWLKRLEEKTLPEEKDVIGKILPVGSKFLKNGRIVEVIHGNGGECCDKCIYRNNGCEEGRGPMCLGEEHYSVYFKYAKQ